MKDEFIQSQQVEGLQRIKNYAYKLSDLLGAGNFSKVYLGTNELNSISSIIKGNKWQSK